MTNHLFLLGCSRSGTTALTNLLNAHEQVVIGMERFKYRCADDPHVQLQPALFEPSRFFRFEAGDTNVTPAASERWRSLYDRARRKVATGEVTAVGDKLPPSAIAALQANFPAPKFIFIFRDVADVASSFVARADDPDDAWPSSKRHESALSNWHAAFRDVATHIDAHGDGSVFTVRYEALFSGRRDVLRAMFNFAGPGVSEDVAHTFDEMTAGWAKRRRKARHLTTAELAHVRVHEGRGLRDDAVERSGRDLQRWA